MESEGQAAHINTFGLGDTGRYRTNVWDYPGISSLGAIRDEKLAVHPTVKPVALIADAIKDCSRRGDIIPDVFGGSGSTLIAAEQCGRVARLIEIDPLYCDTIIRRFERLTGEQARLVQTGRTFVDVMAEHHCSGEVGNQDVSVGGSLHSIDHSSAIPASAEGDR